VPLVSAVYCAKDSGDIDILQFPVRIQVPQSGDFVDTPRKM
jgi:hypothetical protein